SALLHAAARSDEREGASVVLLFDDLHWADAASLDLLCHLSSAGLPPRSWVVATSRFATFVPPPLAELIAGCKETGKIDTVILDRLDDGSLKLLAEAVIGKEGAGSFAKFLGERSQSLPLAVVEWINLLCDEGFLEPATGALWRIARELNDPELAGVGALADLTQRRVNQLPESSRRLLTLASVAGNTFEPELLARAAGEQAGVVELAIAVLLQRWLVRHYPQHWFDSRRERDVVLWSQGVRRGIFEFAHKGTRRMLYDSVPAARRQQLHRQVAEALVTRTPRGAAWHETVAAHALAAEEWRLAVEHLRAAESACRELGAGSEAALYQARAVEATHHLLAVGTPSET
ncbi:MAG: hypothetical protein V1750_11435, partial [Acidobacteriota bacterium]